MPFPASAKGGNLDCPFQMWDNLKAPHRTSGWTNMPLASRVPLPCSSNLQSGPRYQHVAHQWNHPCPVQLDAAHQCVVRHLVDAVFQVEP